MVALGIAIEREKVIPVPNAIDAQIFNLAYRLCEVFVTSMLWV
jgi:hypothetical protein